MHAYPYQCDKPANAERVYRRNEFKEFSIFSYTLAQPLVCLLKLRAKAQLHKAETRNKPYSGKSSKNSAL